MQGATATAGRQQPAADLERLRQPPHHDRQHRPQAQRLLGRRRPGSRPRRRPPRRRGARAGRGCAPAAPSPTPGRSRWSRDPRPAGSSARPAARCRSSGCRPRARACSSSERMSSRWSRSGTSRRARISSSSVRSIGSISRRKAGSVGARWGPSAARMSIDGTLPVQSSIFWSRPPRCSRRAPSSMPNTARMITSSVTACIRGPELEGLAHRPAIDLPVGHRGHQLAVTLHPLAVEGRQHQLALAACAGPRRAGERSCGRRPAAGCGWPRPRAAARGCP